jgi:hypothetical protein
MKKFVSLSALALVAAAGSANATILFDSAGFESPAYSAGNLAGQNVSNPWLQDHGVTAPAQVQTAVVQSGLQAVSMSSTADSTNWLFPNLSYTPASGEVVQISVDIARTLGTTTSFGYLIDVYGTNGARVARFGLGNSAGSVRSVLTLSSGNFLADTTLYGQNQWVHFDAFLDFTSHTWNLLIDGAPVAAGLPMINAAATGIGDADLQMSTAVGANDIGYFDNYVVQAIPAPGAAALLGRGGLAVSRRRRS